MRISVGNKFQYFGAATANAASENLVEVIGWCRTILDPERRGRESERNDINVARYSGIDR